MNRGHAGASPFSLRYRRSPFLTLQWEGRDLVVTNCDTLRRFRVDERLVRVLRYLDDWTTQADLEAADLDVGNEDVEQLAQLGMVERRTSRYDASARYWSCFDLAVQRLQNTGGRDGLISNSRDDRPPPAFKPQPAGSCLVLPEPCELPGRLTDVLKRRRTRRTYSDRPLSLPELSGVLHHSAQVTSTFRDDRLGERSLRPFASGGARSELEIYVVANGISGMSSGAYYYDARLHHLVKVAAHDQYQVSLNRWVHRAAGDGLNRDPQAILLVTAVFARVMWKYPGIGLALIYRNVGCLYQTLYLVADAFDLAPCAIGAGEEQVNSRWLGLDPLVESQVGCFLLGTQ